MTGFFWKLPVTTCKNTMFPRCKIPTPLCRLYRHLVAKHWNSSGRARTGDLLICVLNYAAGCCCALCMLTRLPPASHHCLPACTSVGEGGASVCVCVGGREGRYIDT